MDDKLEVGKNNPLNEEYAYLDGMHRCVHGYKALMLWTYHPGMRKVIKLASMEAKRENTNLITLFLQLLNSVLRDVSKIEDYSFNPCGLMHDGANTNFNAVEKVLGKKFF